jgi:hypothetical protein
VELVATGPSVRQASGRWTKPVCLGLALGILAIAAWFWVRTGSFYAAIDYRLYMQATSRWLAGGPFYEPRQLAGPYAVVHGVILYPPVSLLLFVPFTALPAFTWWLGSLGLAGFGLWRMRPSPYVWPLMALCSWWWTAAERVWSGNPVLWVFAALSLGCAYAGPAAFVLVKPSLFPFAVMGMWRRSWWLALGAFVLLCLPFLGLWADWLTVVRNGRASVLYSLPEIPLLLVPLLALAGSPRLAPTRLAGWRAASSLTQRIAAARQD